MYMTGNNHLYSNASVTGSLRQNQEVILLKMNDDSFKFTFANHCLGPEKKSLHRVNWLFCVNGFGQLCVSDPGNILLHFLWIVTVRISF